jgi:hypothetical protein
MTHKVIWPLVSIFRSRASGAQESDTTTELGELIGRPNNCVGQQEQ